MRKTEPMVARPSPASTNSPGTLLRRRETGALTWRGPALMLFARAALAVGAQGVVAAVFVLNGSRTPWHDAEPWLPVYGTSIDIGCVLLLWRLTRREGIGLLDLVGFQRSRLFRDVLLGLALIPVSPAGYRGVLPGRTRHSAVACGEDGVKGNAEFDALRRSVETLGRPRAPAGTCAGTRSVGRRLAEVEGEVRAGSGRLAARGAQRLQPYGIPQRHFFCKTRGHFSSGSDDRFNGLPHRYIPRARRFRGKTCGS
jgi:hypothetical protein